MPDYIHYGQTFPVCNPTVKATMLVDNGDTYHKDGSYYTSLYRHHVTCKTCLQMLIETTLNQLEVLQLDIYSLEERLNTLHPENSDA